MKFGPNKFRLLSFSVLRKAFSLMARTEKIIAVVLAVAVLSSAVVIARGAYVSWTVGVPTLGGSYSEGLLGQPRLINPLVATSSTDLALVRLVYSSLYTYNQSGVLIPDLADGLPTVSEDGKQYTIKLKTNARWHNNRPVTIEDVLFTVKTLQNPEFNSPLRTLWLNTKIDKVDDNTVTFTNKDVSAPFTDNLTLPILPAGVWKGISADRFLLSSNNLEQAVGSGPYVIKEIEKLKNGQIKKMRLDSFSNYHLGKPYLDNMTLFFYNTNEELVSGLQAHQIDGFGITSLDSSINLDPQQYKLNRYRIPLPQYQAVFLNTHSGPTADLAVRTALQLATNTEQINQDIFNGNHLALGSFILPLQLPDLPKRDPVTENLEQAKEALLTAGWKLDNATGVFTKNKQPLEIELVTNDFTQNAKTARLLADQWKRINVGVTLTILPTSELNDNHIRTRNFQALLFALKTPADPDQFSFLHSSQIKDPGLNITQFTNAEVDRLISEARGTLDEPTRITKYQRIEDIVLTAKPVILLGQTSYVYYVSQSIKGVGAEILFDPSFRFSNVQMWYQREKRSFQR